MPKIICAAVLAAVLVTPGYTASLTLSGLVDGDEGTAVDMDGSLPLAENWIIGAGAGRGDSSLEGEKFSATSLRASTDVQIGDVFANAGVERWKDSGQLRSTTWRAGLGWMSGSGFAATLLVVDRNLDITYTATVAGIPRELQASLDGTGFGGELGWFGTAWTLGARYVGYDYGRNVERIRAIREAAATGRFPRLQRLVTSVATRAAGAPDREMALYVDHRIGRFSIGADWQQQRDAATRDLINSAGITLGIGRESPLGVDLMAGYSSGGSAGTVPWGGVALTLRSAGP